MKKFICAVMVTMFAFLGLAALADRFDSNLHRDAVTVTDAEVCTGNGVHCVSGV